MKHANLNLGPLKARSIELAESHCGIVFGRDRKALCPVHDDKSPSLAYWPKGQRFKCWSCGWSGDIIALYQAVTGATFIDAAKALGATPFDALPTHRKSGPVARAAADEVEIRLYREVACLRDRLRQIADDEHYDTATRSEALISMRECNATLDALLAEGDR